MTMTNYYNGVPGKTFVGARQGVSGRVADLDPGASPTPKLPGDYFFLELN